MEFFVKTGKNDSRNNTSPQNVSTLSNCLMEFDSIELIATAV